ncbi:hypothetical protein [Streptomyces sp. STR69]|uniref:hypothetical protein n=1 Tax=Streptomyces sp. STR69 TaxID=1796942 RepID=UPI0021C72309|nr:hypothetical protein [Streptomyces sp. STR69]
MLISRARYERDMAGLRAEAARLMKERDTAREERDAFQAAAKTSAEHFVQADADKEQLAAAVEGKPLIEGGRTGGLTSLAALAARDHERARGLQKQLDILQAAVLRCTCGGAA